MLDRTVAPPVQPLARVMLPAADVFSLPNGARLHVMHNDAQPVVRLQVVFKAGKWYEPVPGVSLLTARMLLEGTRTRTARHIADEIAFYGASLECEHGFDRATLTLYCLTRHLPKLLPLVVDVLTEPTFPEAEFSLLKTRTIQNIKVERQKTSYLAAEEFSRNLFGPESPYGRKLDDYLFQEISSEQIRQFYQQAYNLNQAEVFLCGDVTSAHTQLISDSLGITTPTSIVHELAVITPITSATHNYISVSQNIHQVL